MKQMKTDEKNVCIIIHVTKSFKLLLSLTIENIFCHNITFLCFILSSDWYRQGGDYLNGIVL